MPQNKDRAVLVTTEYRGVFFGYTDDSSGDTVVLRNARMCVFWSSDMHGIFGLAAHGPSNDCRVGPAVERFEARKVTGVADVSKEAVAKWEAAPWSR